MRVTAIEYGHAFVRVNRARRICRATSPRYFGKLSFPRRVDNRNVAAPIFVAIASVPRMGVDFCTRFDNTSVERLYLRLTAFQFSFTIFFIETVFSSSFFCHTTITAETTRVSANAVQTGLDTYSYLLVLLRRSNDRGPADRSDDQSIKLPSKTHFPCDLSLPFIFRPFAAFVTALSVRTKMHGMCENRSKTLELRQ